ncbi:MAG: regulatory protein RecX [Actinobacteria bacterium]|nr:regulatory protein RecX [Actinomycetota bacterium]
MSSSSPSATLEEVESDPYQVAQTIALIALGRRAKSRGELFTLLKKRGTPEDIANAVLFRLQEQGFVNDRDFARYWVESRQRTKKVSRRIISSELRAKGITDEIIDEAMSEISDDDEFAIAMEFASKKVRSLSRLENSIAYRRLHGALSRRGFSGSVTSRVLAELGISRS